MQSRKQIALYFYGPLYIAQNFYNTKSDSNRILAICKGSFLYPERRKREMPITEAFKLMVQFFWFEFCEMGKYALVGLLIHQAIYWTTGVSLLNELIKATLKEVRR